MKKATLAQGNQVTNLILQKGTSSEQLQKIFKSGLLADLLDANFNDPIDRIHFRRIIGLKSQYPYFHIKGNYDLKIEDLLSQEKITRCRRSVSKNFPNNNKGKNFEIDVQIVHFEGPTTVEGLMREMDNKNLCFIDIFQLVFLKSEVLKNHSVLVDRSRETHDIQIVTVSQGRFIQLSFNPRHIDASFMLGVKDSNRVEGFLNRFSLHCINFAVCSKKDLK